MSATVIVLPHLRPARYADEPVPDDLAEHLRRLDRGELAHQPMMPWHDRRKVIELWRIRLDREFEELRKALRASRDALARARQLEEERNG